MLDLSLEPGVYKVIAAIYDTGEHGKFTLTVTGDKFLVLTRDPNLGLKNPLITTSPSFERITNTQEIVNQVSGDDIQICQDYDPHYDDRIEHCDNVLWGAVNIHQWEVEENEVTMPHRIGQGYNIREYRRYCRPNFSVTVNGVIKETTLAMYSPGVHGSEFNVSDNRYR
jgi:hypothetical protein